MDEIAASMVKIMVHASFGILKYDEGNRFIMATKKKLWIKKVKETSFAMDLPEGIFTRSSNEIARLLKQAVLKSDRTKGTKFQSAMSMLNYYINRAGKNLHQKDKARLERAKVALRKLFGKE